MRVWPLMMLLRKRSDVLAVVCAACVAIVISFVLMGLSIWMRRRAGTSSITPSVKDAGYVTMNARWQP
jgi:hypothetical protein